MTKTNKSEQVPKNMQPVFDAIVALTGDFSSQHLNDEYAQLARYVTATLCRKRPSPLVSGHANTWACGIIYALGFVNFLFDKSEKPYISATDLCKGFNISTSTGSAKSKVVRDSLKMMQFDPNWCLPSKLDNNPMAWLITVNGLMLDARHLPREIQEMAYQKGLIPYIPADKEQ
ncbi:MAG: DUF6398 domain-containing protein [Methylovulum sp.]|nr:DUF6398 domain-containing protein [Methylovulum sp.]